MLDVQIGHASYYLDYWICSIPKEPFLTILFSFEEQQIKVTKLAVICPTLKLVRDTSLAAK